MSKQKGSVSEAGFGGACIGAAVGLFACVCDCASGGSGDAGLAVLIIGAFIGLIIGCVIQSSTNTEIEKEEEQARQRARREAARAHEEQRLAQGHMQTPIATKRMLETRDFGEFESAHEYINSVLPEFKEDAIQATTEFIKDLGNRIDNTLRSGGGYILQTVVKDLQYLCSIVNNPKSPWEDYLKGAISTYNWFTNCNYSAPVLRDSYGVENPNFKESTKSMLYRALNNILKTQDANNDFDVLCNIFRNSSGLDKLKFDWDLIVHYIWYYSLTRPHDAVRLENAQKMYNHFMSFDFKNKYNENVIIVPIDSLLSELYVAKDIGEGVLKKKENAVKQWLDYYISKKNSSACENFASALMWLKAYTMESDALRKMASNGVAMGTQLQERLRFLESGGDKGLHPRPIEPQKDVVQFDYSTLNWRTEDFIAFFKTLAYENASLNYSLTIREWAKTLTLSSSASEIAVTDLSDSISRMI